MIHTSHGNFYDYSEEGLLQFKLKRASIQTILTSRAPRTNYAQSSLWMTNHQIEVENILIDSGIEIPRSDDALNILRDQFETMKLIEDIKTKPIEPSLQDREKGQVFQAIPLSIIRIQLSSLPKINLLNTFDPYFTIKCNGTIINSSDFLQRKIYRIDGEISFEIPNIHVIDEFLITLYDRSSLTGGKEKLGQFWLHTGFIRDYHVKLKKQEIDKIHKDKKHKKYHKDFEINIYFQEASYELEDYVSDLTATGSI